MMRCMHSALNDLVQEKSTQRGAHSGCGAILAPILPLIIMIMFVGAVACAEHKSSLVEGMIYTTETYSWDMFAKYDVDNDGCVSKEDHMAFYKDSDELTPELFRCFFDHLWAEDSVLLGELDKGQNSFCRETFVQKPALGGDLRMAVNAAYRTCLTDLASAEEL